MELAELTALLTPEGLRLLDATGGIRTTDEAAAAVSRLRAAGHSPELVAAVVGQARLRVKAEAKFGEFAERMLFTRAGLEQATRLSVAARHAVRFRDAGFSRVADLGCGIGGDALGLAALGLEVEAVEADEVTAAIAAYNLAPFGRQVRVHHARAEQFDSPSVDAVWLDPARRTPGHTETTRVGAAEWSPPLEWVFHLAERTPAGIKLGPAFDRALLPPRAEAQWISVDGSTIELVVWTRSLARPGVHRAALVVRGDAAHELTAAADTADEPVRPLGAYVHEPDGAVIRARLIGDVARRLEAGMLAPGIAYLTGDAALTSPFVSTFKVRERLPADVKGLSKALRERGIGTLEIKKRGVDVDPAVLRTKLKLSGSGSATLLLTRVGNTRLALLADRVS
ncbi:SAM-dependent methyltransferase [Microbacterium sp. zg.Y625]|uniref:class I SAM-dependent methyltransferase n=1 Tax=Microbacterium jiangjiandongii TaxID=3049071 RepID=UPI00214CF728|nr:MULTISPECIES: class I SAM-dependent methyltransferase [unclassified Microbacterium]MCR2793583.1 SAM-dependent methyltransferase [Microbacterium sp. zg.Y625]MCR2815814.1 SAM-dependent methyltransferase [Microbacterium sp. zg.Y843]WIM25937.1 class I SAM-dependent methyltransferase [Microbacterium sp. zg-Y625]